MGGLGAGGAGGFFGAAGLSAGAGVGGFFSSARSGALLRTRFASGSGVGGLASAFFSSALPSFFFRTQSLPEGGAYTREPLLITVATRF